MVFKFTADFVLVAVEVMTSEIEIGDSVPKGKLVKAGVGLVSVFSATGAIEVLETSAG